MCTEFGIHCSAIRKIKGTSNSKSESAWLYLLVTAFLVNWKYMVNKIIDRSYFFIESKPNWLIRTRDSIQACIILDGINSVLSWFRKGSISITLYNELMTNMESPIPHHTATFTYGRDASNISGIYSLGTEMMTISDLLQLPDEQRSRSGQGPSIRIAIHDLWCGILYLEIINNKCYLCKPQALPGEDCDWGWGKSVHQVPWCPSSIPASPSHVGHSKHSLQKLVWPPRGLSL